MTLEQFYNLTKSGTRVYDSEGKEFHVDQHTKCHLYDVAYFYAVADDLIVVVLE